MDGLPFEQKKKKKKKILLLCQDQFRQWLAWSEVSSNTLFREYDIASYVSNTH